MGTQTKTKRVVKQGTKNSDGSVNNFNPNTGAKLSAGQSVTVKPGNNTYGSNPVVTSDRVRADNNALGVDIRGLKNAYAADNAQIQAQQAALAERRANEIAGIKTEFDIAKGAQEVGQERDFASRATSLITSGGGFLGGTQSQQGVLQNLRGTHETEKTALMAKREAAILAANTAYEDKDFALARELSKNAKEMQNEIYRRQKDYADQTLALTRENRAQTEFDLNIAKDKIEAYAKMDDEQFKSIDPNEFAKYDQYYYPGYTEDARLISKKAATLKTNQDQVDLDYKILTARLNVDAGKTFKLGGVTYTGMKTKDSSGGGGTQADRDALNKQKVQSWFTSATVIPGTDSVPFLDNTGKATPEGWQTAYEYSGMDRRKFIQEFSYILRSSGVDSENNPKYDNYGLTPSEVKIVNTLPPVNY